jgi:probable addiction module antidote protein
LVGNPLGDDNYSCELRYRTKYQGHIPGNPGKLETSSFADSKAYLEASLEEAHGNAAFIARALGDIARAKGMTQVAFDAGLSRESLYKALSGDRTSGFDTILKVVTALGLELHASPLQTKVWRGNNCINRE